MIISIGIASGLGKGGIHSRFKTYRWRKGYLYTHFSVFEVWDNIREEEIREFERISKFIIKRYRCKQFRSTKVANKAD